MEKYTSFKNVMVKQDSAEPKPTPTEASSSTQTRNSARNAPYISADQAFNSGSRDDQLDEEMDNPFLKSATVVKKKGKWWSCMS